MLRTSVLVWDIAEEDETLYVRLSGELTQDSDIERVVDNVWPLHGPDICQVIVDVSGLRSVTVPAIAAIFALRAQAHDAGARFSVEAWGDVKQALADRGLLDALQGD